MNAYYLSFIICKQYNDDVNAQIYLNLARYHDEDLPNHIVQNRNLGFVLKKADQLEKSKEAFRLSAEAGDPISQYELARLLGSRDLKFEGLLKAAQENLAHAKVELYLFYLQTKQYEKAYEKLQECAMERLRFGVQFQIDNFPSLPKNCVVYSYEAPEECFRGESGELVFVKKPTLPRVLHESALYSQNEEERFHFYHLSATQGYAPSIVKLISGFPENRRPAKDLIVSSKNGDEESERKLRNLLRDGDGIAVSEILEIAQASVGEFYIRLVEDASASKNPIIGCALGMMYYRSIGVKQDIGRGTTLLDTVRPEITKLAEDGNKMAQYQLGWIGLEYQEYRMAMKWLSKSAPYFTPALHKLGDLYYYGMHFGMKSSATDPEQAKICYVKAADLGYAPSQVMLGWLALEEKSYERALEWFERGMSQGYGASRYRLGKIAKEVDTPEKQMVVKLAQRLANNQGVSSETQEWAQGILRGNEAVQALLQKGLSSAQSATQEPIKDQTVQQKPEHEEEEEKADQHESPSRGEGGGRDTRVLSFTDVVYDDPRWVAEAQLDAALVQAGKGLQGDGGLGARSSRPCEGNLLGMQKSALCDDLGLSAPAEAESKAKWPSVALPWWSTLDEKLMAQASFFAQGGVVFDTLRDALHTGAAFLSGGLPQEEARDDAYMFDAFFISHLQPALHEFSHFLDFSL